MSEHRATYYRRRADLCRRKASEADDAEQCDRWHELALGFEELAQQVEALEKPRHSGTPPPSEAPIP